MARVVTEVDVRRESLNQLLRDVWKWTLGWHSNTPYIKNATTTDTHPQQSCTRCIRPSARLVDRRVPWQATISEEGYPLRKLRSILMQTYLSNFMRDRNELIVSGRSKSLVECKSKESNRFLRRNREVCALSERRKKSAKIVPLPPPAPSVRLGFFGNTLKGKYYVRVEGVFFKVSSQNH